MHFDFSGSILKIIFLGSGLIWEFPSLTNQNKRTSKFISENGSKDKAACLRGCNSINFLWFEFIYQCLNNFFSQGRICQDGCDIFKHDASLWIIFYISNGLLNFFRKLHVTKFYTNRN